MPIVKYIQHDGTEHELEVIVGQSVMQGAIDNMIEGIVGECGGCCSCATCHCYVDEDWFVKTGEPSDTEKDLLDVASELKPNSRLSCQIIMTEELDGLVVRLPESQYSF